MKEIKKQFARTLRKGQTSTEEKVWSILRNRQCFGLKFRRQHVIEGFVVDFYCHEQRVAIEIDGGIHKNQKDYDEFRQIKIEAKDISFIRITNEEIGQDEYVVINKIKEKIEPSPLTTLPIQSPSPSGRGPQSTNLRKIKMGEGPITHQ